MIFFQEIIYKLKNYWSNIGCTIVQPINLEIGAGTFHPITFFNSIKGNFSFFSYIQLCKRPTDGRYGFSVNKLQEYYQFQVIIKPSFLNVKDLYLNSLKYLGIDFNFCDIRFIEDN